MIIQFDEYEFNGFKYNEEIFVLCDDVAKFIGTIRSNTIIHEIYKMYDNKFDDYKIKLYIFNYNKRVHINWKSVLYITMKYNYDKYTKYRDILEKNLDYKEILENE